jgi:hypothetical protein
LERPIFAENSDWDVLERRDLAKSNYKVVGGLDRFFGVAFIYVLLLNLYQIHRLCNVLINCLEIHIEQTTLQYQNSQFLYLFLR